MRLLYNNLADSAVLSSDNADPNYGLSGIQDIHLTNVFRFADLTGGYIDFDLTEAKDVSCVAIVSNLTASATITLKGHSDESSWASPSVEETVSAADRNLIHYFTSSSYRYWRLEIADASNPDGYIEVSRVFLGTYLQMPKPEPEYTYEIESLSTRQFSPTGQPFSVERPERAFYSFTFPPSFTTAQRNSLITAYKAVGIGTPIFLDVWDGDFSTQDPEYVLFEPDSISFTKFTRGTMWSLSIDFVESK